MGARSLSRGKVAGSEEEPRGAAAAREAPSPTRRRPTSVPWQAPRAQVPSLRALCLDYLSREENVILSTEAIDAIDESLATALLREIMLRRRLTTKLATKFIHSRHADLAEALSCLDLVAGLNDFSEGYASRGSLNVP